MPSEGVIGTGVSCGSERWQLRMGIRAADDRTVDIELGRWDGPVTGPRGGGIEVQRGKLCTVRGKLFRSDGAAAPNETR